MTELDQLDAQIAQASGELIKTLLHVSRLREPEAAREIDALTECQLTVRAVGSNLRLVLTAPHKNGTLLIYGATFSEAGPLH
jgi:hypothetical protein